MFHPSYMDQEGSRAFRHATSAFRWLRIELRIGLRIGKGAFIKIEQEKRQP